MKRKYWAVWIVLFLIALKLAGCGVKVLPVRQYLVRGDLPSRVGAYGYLVFPVKPDPNLKARYTTFCSAYKRHFPLIEEFSIPDEKPLFLVTYWMLEREPPSKGMLEDCDWMIENYDYTKAIQIASAVGKLDAPGPILVAWEMPFEAADSGSATLVLDMTRFEKREDIDRAFLNWKERIAREPGLWMQGFKLQMIKEQFRILINRHGEDILKVIDKLI